MCIGSNKEEIANNGQGSKRKHTQNELKRARERPRKKRITLTHMYIFFYIYPKKKMFSHNKILVLFMTAYRVLYLHTFCAMRSFFHTTYALALARALFLYLQQSFDILPILLINFYYIAIVIRQINKKKRRKKPTARQSLVITIIKLKK